MVRLGCMASNGCLGVRRCLGVFPYLRGVGHAGDLSCVSTAAANLQWLEGARKLAPPRPDPAVALPGSEVQGFSREPTNSHTRQCGRLIPLWLSVHVYLNRLPLDTRVAIAPTCSTICGCVLTLCLSNAVNNHSHTPLFYSCARVKPSVYGHSPNRS